MTKTAAKPLVVVTTPPTAQDRIANGENRANMNGQNSHSRKWCMKHPAHHVFSLVNIPSINMTGARASSVYQATEEVKQ